MLYLQYDNNNKYILIKTHIANSNDKIIQHLHTQDGKTNQDQKKNRSSEMIFWMYFFKPEALYTMGRFPYRYRSEINTITA